MTDGTTIRKEFEGAARFETAVKKAETPERLSADEMNNAANANNPTIEKWKRHYQEKFAEEAKHGGVMFKDLNMSALRSELQFYENAICKTRKGTVSIAMLLAESERLLRELDHVPEENKEAKHQFKKKLKKNQLQIRKHPMYTYWHATYECIHAVETLFDLPEEVQALVL